jgi:hypothetical protein
VTVFIIGEAGLVFMPVWVRRRAYVSAVFTHIFVYVEVKGEYAWIHD